MLAGAAALMLIRPFALPYWAGPTIGAALLVASTAVGVGDAWSSLSPLRDPLLFLVFAVPLAVTLDDVGVFAALAGCVDGGRHLVTWLWVLAAGVVIVFNLDAAVVLLTPLYIRIARRHGYPVEALAFQPALLACLASGVLPVSNLTNLIAAEQLDLGIAEFVRHMLLPTSVACAVGYVAYRRVFPLPTTPAPVRESIDRRALRRGLPIIGFVLLGFTVGDAVGIPAWIIAAVATVWASALRRRVRWRAVPIGAIVVAAALAVLVAAAVPSLELDLFFDRSGRTGRLGALAYGVVASNTTNNLPAILAGGPSLTRTDQVWPLLIGTNLGPVLVVTGSLSTLLWRDTARRADVDVSVARYSSIGVRVGLPALLAAAIVVVALP